MHLRPIPGSVQLERVPETKDVAENLKCRSCSIPPISTGIFYSRSSGIALPEVGIWHYLPGLENVIIDFTYYSRDYVFVNGRNRFGQVEALLVIDGCKWADLTIFDDHQRDQESELVYANDNLQDIFELHQLSELSKSLVTCEQRHVRWFVSYYSDDEKFAWYDDYVQ